MEQSRKNLRENITPFEPGAADRQRRMGLVDGDGKPELESVTILSRVYAGQLFDSFRDYYRDRTVERGVLRRISVTAQRLNPQKKFLLVCAQFDSIRQALPAPIWWISGSPALAGPFAEGFLTHLQTLAEEEIT